MGSRVVSFRVVSFRFSRYLPDLHVWTDCDGYGGIKRCGPDELEAIQLAVTDESQRALPRAAMQHQQQAQPGMSQRRGMRSLHHQIVACKRSKKWEEVYAFSSL